MVTGSFPVLGGSPAAGHGTDPYRNGADTFILTKGRSSSVHIFAKYS